MENTKKRRCLAMGQYEEILAEVLMKKVENLSDNSKKAFVKRSIDDARNIIKEIEDNPKVDVEKLLSYTIYRAYTIGAALYDNSETRNED